MPFPGHIRMVYLLAVTRCAEKNRHLDDNISKYEL